MIGNVLMDIESGEICIVVMFNLLMVLDFGEKYLAVWNEENYFYIGDL